MTVRVLGALVIWVALFRRVTLGVLMSGLIAAAVALWLVPDPATTRVRPRALFRLLWIEAKAVLRATVDVAAVVLSPSREARPGLLRIELPDATERELAWLASLATLTPGSFAVETTTPPGLQLHALDASRPEVLAQEVHDLHDRVRAALRSPHATAHDAVPSSQEEPA